MEPLEIDGSYGEGGGQILRTAVAFSIILGRPVKVSKIRAGRGNPGLRQQHASALRILREVSGGRLEGGEVGSTSISFFPGVVEAAEMKVDLRTAASITLVLQAVVPAASLSRSSLDLQLVGGTDVPWSPTLDYFEFVVLPSLKLLGIDGHIQAGKRGYYPRGGGVVRARIEPCKQVIALDLSKRDANPTVSIISRCGRLPSHVAERQSKAALAYLANHRIAAEAVSTSQVTSDSPGSSILVSTTGRGLFLGSDSIGARGKSSEAVGREAAEAFVGVYASGACVDPHLSDTLAPILSLGSSESRLLVPQITEHLRTSLYVAKLFTACSYEFSPQERAWLVLIRPEKHNI